MNHALKLEELAHRAGVSPRTVRYYIQRGLLPAADFKGPDTAYSERHLLGLRAIRTLQDAYWPLDAIASALLGKDEAALRKIAGGEIPTTRVPAETGRSRPIPEPAAHLASASEAPEESRVTRLVLAPGVDLLIDERAPETSRRLVERIKHLLKEGRS